MKNNFLANLDNYHPPNHLEGGLRVARGPRITVFEGYSSSSSSSSIISTAVVRGLEGVVDGLGNSGAGNAARRVFAGGGTVIVWVCTTVLVSYTASETTTGGSSRYYRITKDSQQTCSWKRENGSQTDDQRGCGFNTASRVKTRCDRFDHFKTRITPVWQKYLRPN
ncbi:hypothetical protein BDQ17DRAFT_363099 [Cyathus striatus]|nr:hypothetical protein BDQ17DRAFT_363099 [Cyathus striatus]